MKKKSDKQILFERMHKVAGMPLNENTETQDIAVNKLKKFGFKLDKTGQDFSNPGEEIYYMSKKSNTGGGILAQVDSDGDVDGVSVEEYLNNIQ